MSDTKFIKGNCYECGGSIEYPSYVTTEVVSCPHCQKMVVLKKCISTKVPAVSVPAKTPAAPVPGPRPPRIAPVVSVPVQNVDKPKPWWINPNYHEPVVFVPTQDVDKPPRPVLTSIFYFLGCLILFVDFFVGSIALMSLGGVGENTHLAGVLGVYFVSLFFSALIQFGIGQAVLFLGESAFFTRKSFELQKREWLVPGGI